MTRRPPPYGGTRRRSRDTIKAHDPYRDQSVNVRTVEAVHYYWPEWYTKVVTDDGHVLHWGPWKSEWAARQCALILARLFLRRGQLTGGVHAQ